MASTAQSTINAGHIMIALPFVFGGITHTKPSTGVTAYPGAHYNTGWCVNPRTEENRTQTTHMPTKSSIRNHNGRHPLYLLFFHP